MEETLYIDGHLRNYNKIHECLFHLINSQYPTESMTDADYADDLMLLANTLAQAESLLHRLEQAEECFKQKRAISSVTSL